MIPKQDIIDGLPIRWTFHCWMCAPHARWEFTDWRRYLLSWDLRGYQKVFDLFEHPQFMHDTQHFLSCNNADTIAGFIKFWFKCCKEYEKLLNE